MRKPEFDLMRTVAIVSVVLCHAVEASYPMQEVTFKSYNQYSQLFALALFAFGRVGVPLFFMLTGYFVLTKHYEDENAIRYFYQTKLYRIYLASVAGILMINCVNWLISGVSLRWIEIVKQCLFITYLPGVQTWYIPVVVGSYIWIPLVARGLRDMSSRIVVIAVVAVFIYRLLIQDVNAVLKLFEKPELISEIDFGFVTIYGVYIISGWLLYQGVLTKVKTSTLLWVGLGSFVLVILLMFLTNYKVWYNSGLLFMCSVALFELITRIDMNQVTVLTNISLCSFGIYWIHGMAQKVFLEYSRNIDNRITKTILLFLSSFVVSFVLVSIYLRIGAQLRKSRE
ncbi:acyltransferase [Aerococcaceae bacterium NML191219]|nr:acyltransferase [Aerococcaceae bacterium NML191219]